MSIIERASHPSRAQIEILLEFLERNSSLAKGFSKIPHARDAARKLWDKLALQLNSLGGCIKTSKQWIKYWADKKSAVKKKGALRFRTKNKTGGGAEVVELSDIEERILALMGGDSFAIGDRHLEINPFEEGAQNANPSVLASSHQNQPSSTEQTTPNSIIAEVPDTEQCLIEIMEPSRQYIEHDPGTSQAITRPSNVHMVNAQSMHNSPSLLAFHLSTVQPQSSDNIQSNIIAELPDNNQSFIEVPRTPPQTSNEPVLPSTPSGSGRHPRRPARIVRRRLVDSPTNRQSFEATSGGLRQRRRRPVSPPSQRRSHLTGLTERFVRLEELRLEVDSRNSETLAALVNREAERDRSTIRALEAIGDGLKLLAEVLKNK